MKKIILSILAIFISHISFAQIHEIGAFIGTSNFIGDVGKTNYWYPNAFGGGIIYKYNLNPRVAFRGNYTYTGIKGNDNESNNPSRGVRKSNFTNNINELALGLEINFFHYNINERGTSYTPYIFTQAAIISYEKAQSLNRGNLLTTGATGYALPIGIGFKGRLAENFAFAIESGIRFTTVDNLDYTTPNIPELDFSGQGNDHYVFTALSVVYTFGRPPCFAKMEN